MASEARTPLALIILDGFGYSPRCEGNAIALASTPNFDNWFVEYPNTLIDGSGRSVGLPPGQMGNSEVGHLNIGAGRIVRMDISRIDADILSGDFFENKTLTTAVEAARQSSLHLMGLVSHGGVHSWHEHLYALLRLAAARQISRVYVHAFLDGRDTAPDSGAGYLAELAEKMREYGVGRIASVVGRYYAMDRDKRWERTELAYRLLVNGEGRQWRDPIEAVQESYREGITDEFVKPVVIVDENEQPIGRIQNGDSVIFFNFRADRARQLTRALVEDDFAGFERGERPHISLATMTQYDAEFEVPAAYPPEQHPMILADILARHGKTNARIAETEKYAHVTFFFNGGVEKAFPGETRIMIPSPKVATYDHQPEMSATEVTYQVLAAVERDEFDVLVINFANADMVGHTGDLTAAIKAVETIDGCLGRIVKAIRDRGGSVIITADHGNVEQMIDPTTGAVFTAHTSNPVPLILIGDYHGRLRPGGSLQDIAPTMLGILGLPKPAEMTGRDLRIDIKLGQTK